MVLFGINSLLVVVLSMVLISYSKLTEGLAFVLLMIIIFTSSIVAFVAFVEAIKTKPRKEQSVGGIIESIIKQIIH